MFVVQWCHQRSNRFPAGLGLIPLIVFLPPGSNPRGKMRKKRSGVVSLLASLHYRLNGWVPRHCFPLLLPLANWEAENQSESGFTTTEPRKTGCATQTLNNYNLCLFFFFFCFLHTHKSLHHQSLPSQFMQCQTAVKDAKRNVSLKINYSLSLLGHLPRNSPSCRRTLLRPFPSCQHFLCAQDSCHISFANSTLKMSS